MEYKCPIYESRSFSCDRKAQYLVAGTMICAYHALQAAMTTRVHHIGPTNETITVPKEPAKPHQFPQFIVCPYCKATWPNNYTSCLACGGYFA